MVNVGARKKQLFPLDISFEIHFFPDEYVCAKTPDGGRGPPPPLGELLEFIPKNAFLRPFSPFFYVISDE